ncbi:MAG: hypothetical protein HY368_00320, partial [Candidatus Aenigmarchaeota archaeon]|nr:hypothetical protein [Candidatus Aenigmarchaeota archaeon]
AGQPKEDEKAQKPRLDFSFLKKLQQPKKDEPKQEFRFPFFTKRKRGDEELPTR